MKKVNVKQLVITLIIIVAGFFGYKVIVEPPVNTVTTKVSTIDTTLVDSTFNLKDTVKLEE